MGSDLQTRPSILLQVYPDNLLNRLCSYFCYIVVYTLLHSNRYSNQMTQAAFKYAQMFLLKYSSYFKLHLFDLLIDTCNTSTN